MLLKSELDGWKIEYGSGETVGRVKDLVVDTERTNWPVTEIVLTRGIGRGHHVLDVPTKDLEVDPHARRLIRRGHAALREEPKTASALDRMRLSGLRGARVYSKDDQLIGTAYDFAIATSPPGGWLVWRFLVAVPGVRSRRLRLHVGDVESVAKGRMVLKATKDELRGSV